MNQGTLLSVVFVAAIVLPATAMAEADPGTKIDAFIEAHDKKMAAFGKKIQGASKEEQGAIYQSDYPDPTTAVVAITEIVKANPKDDASLDGIAWILRYSRNGAIDPGLIGILEEHHMNNEKLVEVTASLMRVPSPEAQSFLKAASENSEVKDVRGMAIFAMAMGIERDTSKSDEYTDLIKRLIEEHQDLEIRGRSIAKMAEGKLFAAKNLGIGMRAPEIVGKDVDGNEMKLSDYKGKIVVIDFWGDW
ncbi:MAG: peroxiredoxin family protein [Verrucomicrobiales bacterium]